MHYIKNNSDTIDLEHLYPDHDVINLYKYTALYRRIYNHARNKKQNIEEYLHDLGFIYIGIDRHDETDWELVVFLNQAVNTINTLCGLMLIT